MCGSETDQLSVCDVTAASQCPNDASITVQHVNKSLCSVCLSHALGLPQSFFTVAKSSASMANLPKGGVIADIALP